MVDSELEAFKTQIDLRQYAGSKGYELTGLRHISTAQGR